MIGFLLGSLLFGAVVTTVVVSAAVILLAWGTRRQKLAEAWLRGHDAGFNDARGTPAPYVGEPPF